jgi:hypothetical protein
MKIVFTQKKNMQWYASVWKKGRIVLSSTNGDGYARRIDLKKMLSSTIANFDKYEQIVKPKKQP